MLKNPKNSFWEAKEYWAWDEVRDSCDKMCGGEFMSKLCEINNFRTISKRGLIGGITVGSTGFVFGVCTSNLFARALKVIGIKDESAERIERLPKLVEMTTRTEALERKINLTKTINRALIDAAKAMQSSIENNQRHIARIEQQQPSVAWTIAFIQHTIAEQTNLLDNIIARHHRGLVATRQLAQLIGFYKIINVPEEDTMMKSVIIKGESTISFRFLIRERSTTAKVVRIISFTHWRNLGVETKLVSYSGQEYAIYNQSNSCLNGIERPEYIPTLLCSA